MRSFIYVVIIVLLIFAITTQVGDNLRGFVLSFFEKPFVVLNETTIELKILWLSLASYSSIFEKNTSLLEENYKLLSKNAELKSFEQENKELKKQLSLSKREPYRLEPVRVFLFSYNIKSAGAFIDKGKDFGVKEGQEVVYGGNVLLGFVQEVFDSQSRISLITDQDISLNIKTGDDIYALARGDGQNRISLDFISLEDEINEKDDVFTNGMDGVAGNLLVGTIGNIEVFKEGLFKKVSVKPAFEKINSTQAFVIMP